MRFVSALLLLMLAACIAAGCDNGRSVSAAPAAEEKPTTSPEKPRAFRVVHVFVPLCDNKHQGIVPVPTALGNGQDPRNNLYWGAMYGTKTFFKRSPHWKLISKAVIPKQQHVLESCLFKSRKLAKPVYVVMMAYDGRHMKAALSDFFEAAAGRMALAVSDESGKKSISLDAGGGSDLVCFVGHNGLMDMEVKPAKARGGSRLPESAVVLACRSNSFFSPRLRRLKCTPLITTSGLMAPEAYTLDAIIRSWAIGDKPKVTRDKAAAAYAKYQKCRLNAAKRLFVAAAET